MYSHGYIVESEASERASERSSERASGISDERGRVSGRSFDRYTYTVYLSLQLCIGLDTAYIRGIPRYSHALASIQKYHTYV